VDPSIEAVQKALEATARAALRYIVTNDLTPLENRKLAKFIFGCMNQKFTIADRVQRRGSRELQKVLEFISKASEAFQKIDERMQREEEGESYVD
jgi:hypothetical protein